MSFSIEVFARDDDNVYVEFKKSEGQKIIDFTLGPDGADWFAQALTEKAARVREMTAARPATPKETQ